MSVIEIMQRVQSGELSANEAANLVGTVAKAPAKLTFKVSDKGALSLYGMGRFPVTLYREQWERVLAHGEDIKSFIKANEGKLTTKQAAA